MQARELSYTSRTGDSVYLGVGSYGNKNVRAGKCYRITATGVDRDLLVQVVNQGGDVPDGNFDLQLGDGGTGLFNACTNAGSGVPQYDGSVNQWGNTYGGWRNILSCENLPSYPHCGVILQDDLKELCKWSFRKQLRTNPIITAMCEVACPVELYTATGIRRSDEINNAYVCGTSGVAGGGILTRMMDCTKPSYGWQFNIGGPTYPGFEVFIPCRRDGYTRINTF